MEERTVDNGIDKGIGNGKHTPVSQTPASGDNQTSDTRLSRYSRIGGGMCRILALSLLAICPGYSWPITPNLPSWTSVATPRTIPVPEQRGCCSYRDLFRDTGKRSIKVAIGAVQNDASALSGSSVATSVEVLWLWT